MCMLCEQFTVCRHSLQFKQNQLLVGIYPANISIVRILNQVANLQIYWFSTPRLWTSVSLVNCFLSS